MDEGKSKVPDEYQLGTKEIMFTTLVDPNYPTLWGFIVSSKYPKRLGLS